MFSALRQQKSARYALIAAKMADAGAMRSRMALALIRPAGVEITFGLARHDGTVDLKAAGLRDHFVEAEGFVQHFRVRQKAFATIRSSPPLLR